MDALELGKLIILLGGIAGIYAKIHSSMRQMAGKGEIREIAPNPLPVLNAPRAATMEDIIHLETRLLSLERRFETHMETNSSQIEKVREDITELRNRVDDKMELNAEKLSEYGDVLRQIERSLGRLEKS